MLHEIIYKKKYFGTPFCSITYMLIYLLLIIAYNEKDRLPVMLKESVQFLEGRKSSYEVIVVDDGSKVWFLWVLIRACNMLDFWADSDSYEESTIKKPD